MPCKVEFTDNLAILSEHLNHREHLHLVEWALQMAYTQKKGTKALPFQKVHFFLHYLLLKGAYKYLKAIY